MNTKNRTRKYKITSKTRFTIFMVIVILAVTFAASTLLGFNTVNSTSKTQYNQVEVQTGDTIWAIANQYKSDDQDVREVVYDICDLNDIKADSLTAGQNILIPVYN